MTPRARLLRLPLLVAGLGVAFVLSRHWPSDHTLRVVLGASAPDVRDLRVRYAEKGEAAKDEWLREVALHYAPGAAPRVVSHEARLPGGDYDVELELSIVPAATPTAAPRTVSLTRHVTLGDHPVSVDVSSDVRDALPDAPP